MLRYLSFSVFSLLLFSHCTQEKPDIRVVCETMSSGSYKIKWETFPPIDGTVKIFESTVPDSFNLSLPIAETDIKNNFKDIFNIQSNKRSYFKLVFNKNQSVVTAERTIPMQGLFNFRYLGGYYTTNGELIKWGKLYRSSSLSNATLQDAKVLADLGIKTVIDLRAEYERYSEPPRFRASRIYNFPLRGNPSHVYADAVFSGRIRAGDARIYLQDIFYSLLEYNYDFFEQIFDILLDTDNYPVLISCSAGSDRSAVAAALVLAALDIDMEQIISDYMLTNEQTDLSLYLPFMNEIYSQDSGVQETFTTLYRMHRGTITYSFEKIIKEYESLDNFFATALKLNPEKREKLKKILLD